MTRPDVAVIKVDTIQLFAIFTVINKKHVDPKISDKSLILYYFFRVGHKNVENPAMLYFLLY